MDCGRAWRAGGAGDRLVHAEVGGPRADLLGVIVCSGSGSGVGCGRQGMVERAMGMGRRGMRQLVPMRSHAEVKWAVKREKEKESGARKKEGRDGMGNERL